MSKHILFVHAMYVHKRRSYEVAKDRGLVVSVVGPELPAWARPYVDHFVPADTGSPRGMHQALEALRERHRIEPFDGVATYWDHGVVPAADIAMALDLPGSPPHAARRARNKAAARAALARAGVPQPEFARVTSWPELRAAAARVGYPAIYKPTGGAGSAGVFRIDSAARLRETYELARRYAAPDRDSFFAYHPDEFVLERFLAGPEVSVEGVVARGRVHVAGVTGKRVTDDAFVEYEHVLPAPIPETDRAAAVRIATDAVAAVGLDDCGFHAEVMLTPDGPRIVEVNGRLGGDFIASHLVPTATGIDLVGASLDAAMGEPVDLRPSVPGAGAACVRFLLPDRPGVVTGWTGLAAASRAAGVLEVGLNKHEGDQVALPPEAFFDRLGYLVAAGADPVEAAARAGAALDLVRCEIG